MKEKIYLEFQDSIFNLGDLWQCDKNWKRIHLLDTTNLLMFLLLKEKYKFIIKKNGKNKRN